MAPSSDLTPKRQVGTPSSYLDPGQVPGREHEHGLHPCLQRVGGNFEYAHDAPDISDAKFQEAVQQAYPGAPELLGTNDERRDHDRGRNEV